MAEMKETAKPWFDDGLKFKCTGCGKCCTGAPGYVYLSQTDLENLSKRLKLSPQDFAVRYTRLVDGQYALLDRPFTSDCIFLENKKCTVYESRPTQCRTYPWWLQNLKNPEDWESAKEKCEGIDHPDAPTIPSLQIQEQCLTHLDNFIDQHFSL